MLENGKVTTTRCRIEKQGLSTRSILKWWLAVPGIVYVLGFGLTACDYLAGSNFNKPENTIHYEIPTISSNPTGDDSTGV